MSAEISHGSGAFTALRYPNYRLWFAGQLVSLLGTWMQNTAQAFLVFELTRSSAFLGYVAFAGGMPAWLLMLYGGVVADRVPRRTLLLVTQGSMMLLAFGLGGLTLFGQVRPSHVLLFAFLLGVANAFDAPARQSFVLEMVSKEDLANAIALNSSMFNAGAAVGPAVAGLTYVALGPGWCFLLNGVSFVAVLVALGLMRLERRPGPRAPGSPLTELKAGVLYAAREPSIRTLITLVGAMTIFGISFTTLLPAWAVRILGGDATTNGLLVSARGVGALGGALGIAALGRFRHKGRVLVLGSLLFPVVLGIFSLTRSLGASLVTLLVAGAASILVLNLANALVQTLVRDELRGRVMGIYSLIFLGSMPIGGVLMGALGERVGEPAAVALGAACLLTVALLARWRTPSLARLE